MKPSKRLRKKLVLPLIALGMMTMAMALDSLQRSRPVTHAPAAASLR